MQTPNSAKDALMSCPRRLLAGIGALVLVVSMESLSMAQSPGQPIQLASAKSETLATKSEFQVRTDIYTDDSKPPINSIQTIFTSGLAIEFDDQRERYTVVDTAKARVSILDKGRKVIVHMRMDAIEGQLARAMQLLNQEQRDAFAPDGPPLPAPGNRFAIGNASVRYEFMPVNTKPEIAISYAEFSNWVTRIHALFGPRMPPQVRLEMNRVLADQSQLPVELRRIVVYGGKSEKPVREEIIARLILTESLAESDKSRVASIYQWMQDFKQVSESVFFQ
jgi:hypothetical protein